MKTQTSAQSQPIKKLTLNKEHIRLLTTEQAPHILGPTAIDCSITCR